MESGQREILKLALKHLDNPAGILDKSLKFVYSNCPDILSDGLSIEELIPDKLQFPANGTVRTMLIMDGVTYCARICPLDKEYAVCELFNSKSIINIAENTDIRNRIIPICNSVEHSTSMLWKTYFAMRDCIDNKEDISEYEVMFYDRISELSSVIKNIFEYSMMFVNYSPTIINAVSLTNGIVDRCNTILAKCGRCIQFICESDRLFICADTRHAVTALANSIQNALLFSPRDCVPVLSLMRLTENNENYVYFQLVNENIFFVDKGFGADSIDFKYQRSGFGIPIIKRFVEEAGGSFYMDSSSNTVKLGLKFHEAYLSSETDMRVEENTYTYYDTGIPDIIDVKMNEVVNLFS